jgi:UDP-N-acetylmuramoylalanine--D-glutamate ligase
MSDWTNKQVLVLGLGGRGRAACELLARRGARVSALDDADTPDLRATAAALRALGVEAHLAARALPAARFDFAVLSPAVTQQHALVRQLDARGVPVTGVLELASQQFQCLSIAITGTNGKGTTAELVEKILRRDQRRVLRAGHGALPVCAAVDETRKLDYLILQLSAFHLETTQFFRPAVAVLLNLAPDHLDRYASREDFIRCAARVFRKQQAFDWAVIQSEAFAQLRALGITLPSKVITFSATDPEADLHLDRGLLLSRLPDWTGPLLNVDQCRLRGPHNAENLMAALAVGRVLRAPLETMVDTLKTCEAGPHRFEVIAEINGVKFINDSKATNVDATRQALLSIRPASGGQPNVWLIAGGRDKGLDFHEVGPVLNQRVKRAFLLGEAAKKIRAAWGLFTPCTVVGSLLEAVTEAAKRATPGDAVLFSPACSSFDQFRNYQQRGEFFCSAVQSIGGGAPGRAPKIHDTHAPAAGGTAAGQNHLLRGFVRENPEATEPKNNLTG